MSRKKTLPQNQGALEAGKRVAARVAAREAITATKKQKLPDRTILEVAMLQVLDSDEFNEMLLEACFEHGLLETHDDFMHELGDLGNALEGYVKVWNT